MIKLLWCKWEKTMNIAMVGWLDRSEELCRVLSNKYTLFRIGVEYNQKYVQKSEMQIFNNQTLFLEKPMFFGNTLTKMHRCFKIRSDVDLYHMHMAQYALFKYVCNKKPVVLTIHHYLANEAQLNQNLTNDSMKYRLLYSIEKKGTEMADALIAVDSTIKDYLIDSFDIDKKSVFCIPNGINPNCFPVQEIADDFRSKYANNEEILLVCARKFGPAYGTDVLLRAMNLIINEEGEKAIKLILVGGGQLHKSFIKYIKSNNLGDNIYIKGRVPHSEILEYLSIADININTFSHIPNVKDKAVYSMTEALDNALPISTSNTTLEGLASGKCTIVCTAGGIYSGISPTDTGVLLPDKNEDMLADVIIKLTKDSTLRAKLGSNGRNYIIKNRTWETIANQVEAVYNHVIG